MIYKAVQKDFSFCTAFLVPVLRLFTSPNLLPLQLNLIKYNYGS